MQGLGTAGENFHFIQSHICVVSGKQQWITFGRTFLYTRHPIAARYVGSLRDAPESKISE